jgi:cytochrome c-type biogenesis protein CcmE
VAVEQSGRPDVTTRQGATTGRKRRRKAPWSLVIAGVAIAGAVLYLVLANTGASAEYYMTIKELHACGSCSQRIVRVAGFVAPNSIVKNDQTQVLHFTITDSTLSMPVVYGGTVPDIFRAGVQVVVEGRLGTGGVFQAQNLLAKCPSKFQSATPAPGQ